MRVALTARQDLQQNIISIRRALIVRTAVYQGINKRYTHTGGVDCDNLSAFAYETNLVSQGPGVLERLPGAITGGPGGGLARAWHMYFQRLGCRL